MTTPPLAWLGREHTVTERAFQAAVVALLRACGWLCFYDTEPRRSVKGWPDLVAVRERIIFVELKTTRGRLRPEQRDWLDRLRAAGAETYVWRPTEWEEIVATVQAYPGQVEIVA